MPANHPIKSDGPVDGEDTGRVLRFEPRRGSHWPRPLPPSVRLGRAPPEDGDPHAGADDGEDYRYRMRANLAAVIVVGLLIWCGYWLFITLAELRKTQDCALSGRTNCVRIDVPPAR